MATQGLLDDVPLEKVAALTDALMERLEMEHGEVLQGIEETGTLSGMAAETIRSALLCCKENLS